MKLDELCQYQTSPSGVYRWTLGDVIAPALCCLVVFSFKCPVIDTIYKPAPQNAYADNTLLYVPMSPTYNLFLCLLPWSIWVLYNFFL